MARQISGRRRWRHPTPHRQGSLDTPSPRGLTSRDRDPCANPDPRSSAACWHPPESGSHQRQNLPPQPAQPRGMLRRPARTRGERHSPRGNARCGHARTLNGPGWHLRCRACRTNDRRGSPALHGRSIAPSGSQRHTPRPASGSSTPDRLMGDPSMNNEVLVRCEARKDRAQHRSSAPDDLREPPRQDETRRTVDLGHSSDGPSWIDLAAIRVDTTESRLEPCLNRLLQQNRPLADVTPRLIPLKYITKCDRCEPYHESEYRSRVEPKDGPTGLRRQPFPEARQASAISEAMSSSGRRLKSFASSPMILPLSSWWKCLRNSPRVLGSETTTRCSMVPSRLSLFR